MSISLPVRISSGWNTREGAPLGRNRYVEFQIKKPMSNGGTAKQPAIQKPCEKMTEAIERASQILRISQPALSRQITELEEQRRRHLLVREKGG